VRRKLLIVESGIAYAYNNEHRLRERRGAWKRGRGKVRAIPIDLCGILSQDIVAILIDRALRHPYVPDTA
jgi:hypothetical protein